jgi:4-amino-4-deoxy-L-arabinose transferase-like glycosyltransferase
MAETLVRRFSPSIARAAMVATLLLAFFLSGIRAADRASVTFDEFAHVPAGVAYWKESAFFIYPHNPPLARLISTLPILASAELPSIDPVAKTDPESRWTFAEDFMFRNLKAKEDASHGPDHKTTAPDFSGYHRLILTARMPVLILGVLLGGIIFLWSRRLFGFTGGLLSLALYCFCPNMLAHASLATTELSAAFFVTLAMFAAYLFHEQPRWKNLFFAGSVFGLAMLTKFTALIALPAALLLFLIPSRYEEEDSSRPLRRRIMEIAVCFVLVWLVFCAGYFFTDMLRTLGSMPFHSSSLMKLKDLLPDWTPLSLPSSALMGIDAEMVRSERNLGVFYLLGQLSRKGWLHYFPVALLVKSPIPVLILWGVALVLGVRVFVLRWNPQVAFSLLLPPFFFFVFFLFMRGSNYGVRYVLVCFPFLFILSGIIAQNLCNLRNLRIKIALAALLVWHIAGSVSISPHYLTYFNEIAGGPIGGIRILADSNLDWGHQLKDLRRYMDEKGIKEIALSYTGPLDPKVYGIQWKPLRMGQTKGMAAVSANHLIGFFPMGGSFGGGIQDFGPLLRLKPETVLANSLYVYDLK